MNRLREARQHLGLYIRYYSRTYIATISRVTRAIETQLISDDASGPDQDMRLLAEAYPKYLEYFHGWEAIVYRSIAGLPDPLHRVARLERLFSLPVCNVHGTIGDKENIRIAKLPTKPLPQDMAITRELRRIPDTLQIALVHALMPDTAELIQTFWPNRDIVVHIPDMLNPRSSQAICEALGTTEGDSTLWLEDAPEGPWFMLLHESERLRHVFVQSHDRRLGLMTDIGHLMLSLRALDDPRKRRKPEAYFERAIEVCARTAEHFREICKIGVHFPIGDTFDGIPESVLLNNARMAAAIPIIAAHAEHITVENKPSNKVIAAQHVPVIGRNVIEAYGMRTRRILDCLITHELLRPVS